MKKLSLLLLAALTMVACSDSGPEDTDAQIDVDLGEDAGEPIVIEDAEARTTEIGTGADVFEMLTAGQDVVLTQGPQGGGRWGGFHIWHAVRTLGLDHRGITMRFETRLASTNEVLASQERRANLVSDGTGHFIAYGIAPAFPDCCKAAGNDVVMAVQLTDASGRTGSDELVVHAGVCRDFSGLDLCL